MKELILKAKEDSSCSLEIIQAFEPLIKKCVKIYVHDFAYYEDALQQGRLIFLSCLKSYDVSSPYPFPAYVKKSLCYGMRDFSLKIKESISLDEPMEEDFTLYDLLPSKDNTEESFGKRDTSQAILHCLSQLPEGQRRIIEDCYYKNKTMVEISQNKRCHYMSVVKQKQRALAALKRMLEDEGLL
jgi:RNA polymerase sporulation-specific sigma factor